MCALYHLSGGRSNCRYLDEAVRTAQDFCELSIDCIRGMISNAVCHRAHISPGAIYDDRLEVTSPGRISPDLTMEQLKACNSRVRNAAIGAAFQYMHVNSPAY